MTESRNKATSKDSKPFQGVTRDEQSRERLSRFRDDEFRPGDRLAEASVPRPDGRTLRLSLTLLRIEPTPLSKSLIYHYRLEAHSDCPDSYLSKLGFDSSRLRALDLAPDSILLAYSETSKELESTEVSRYHKALMSGFEKWVTARDFSQKMKDEIARHVRNGPKSRFSEPL